MERKTKRFLIAGLALMAVFILFTLSLKAVDLRPVGPEDTSNTSYHSQISSVFKVQGKKDLYIAVADRWVPDHMDYRYEEYMKAYEDIFSPDFDGVPSLGRFGNDTERNTSLADYVWLPFRFDENGMAFLDWKDEWRIEDYA